MPSGTNRIPLGEYEHLCEIDVAYEGFVEGDNGELFYVYCEATVVGFYENKWHMSYETATRSYEVPVHPTDNTRVANQYDRLSYQPESIKDSAVKDQVRRNFLDRLLSYYQENYGKWGKNDDYPFGQGETKIDVPEHQRRAYFQDDFAQLKSKIENGTIRRSDFKDNVRIALKREIDTYFACFDPNDSNYKSFWNIEDKGFDWETMIPVWGNIKMSTESLNRGLGGQGPGHYFHSVGHFLMAFADMICLGMGTGASGLAKSGGMLSTIPSGVKHPYYHVRIFRYYAKPLRAKGSGEVCGFTISRRPGYGAHPRFDFERIGGPSRETSRLTIPNFLRDKPLPHWHKGKGNNLRYHRPWEVGPDGIRRW